MITSVLKNARPLARVLGFATVACLTPLQSSHCTFSWAIIFGLSFWCLQLVEKPYPESWEPHLRLFFSCAFSTLVTCSGTAALKNGSGGLTPERCLWGFNGWGRWRLQVLWRRHRPDSAKKNPYHHYPVGGERVHFRQGTWPHLDEGEGITVYSFNSSVRLLFLQRQSLDDVDT